MQIITRSQVQELVVSLPAKKLPTAYRLLAELSHNNGESSPQIDFMLLTLEERRSLMLQQAQQMVIHYEEAASESDAWQTGDFVDY